jgi:hypothetical protein
VDQPFILIETQGPGGDPEFPRQFRDGIIFVHAGILYDRNDRN